MTFTLLCEMMLLFYGYISQVVIMIAVDDSAIFGLHDEVGVSEVFVSLSDNGKRSTRET